MGRYNNAAYITQSNRLLASGRDLLASLADPAKLAAVEAAAQPHASSQLGFSAASGGEGLTALGVDPDDGLRAILFDIQSANVLIASGLATQPAEPNRAYLSQALDHIEQSQSEMTTQKAVFLFADGSVVKSSDLNSARESFRADSQFSLDRFVSQASEVVQSIFDRIKDLDGAKILEAIGNLGKPFQAVIDAGRLVKKGIEKLFKSIQSLLDLLGAGALGELKAHVQEVWSKLVNGDYLREVLTRCFGVKDTLRRIEKLLAVTNLDGAQLDAASNALRPLTESYASKIALIKALRAAVILAAGGLAYFHVVAPWLGPAEAIAFLALMGATVVIGMNYCGAGGSLHWVKGVRDIAGELSPSAS